MTKENLYDSLAWCYDFITTGEDHKVESDFVKIIAGKYKKSRGNKLLDVGCGHGWHDLYLKDAFKIIGIDRSRTMLNIARRRNPEVDYRQADVQRFDLKKKFDVVICFDVLEHLLNYQDLKSALSHLERHMLDDGILVFYMDELKENPLTPFQIKKVEKADTKIILVEVNHDSNPDDLTVEDCLVFVILREGKPLEVKYVKGKTGLFEMNGVRKILDELGLRSMLFSGDFSSERYSKDSPFPVFVCTKQSP